MEIGLKKQKKRNEVILATKVAGPGLNWIRGGGNQYDDMNLNEAVNGSLRRLKTDYIDLYQLHWLERKSNFFGRLGYQHIEENDWNKFEDILGSVSLYTSPSPRDLSTSRMPSSA